VVRPLFLPSPISSLFLPTLRIATDNDEDGAGFAAIIQGLVAEKERGDLAVERAVPVDAKDWNDALLRASRVALTIA